MSKKSKAFSMIDEYAWAHSGTAVIAGQFGGQFGVDRIPLTLLTVQMIRDLCSLYGVDDGLARKVHIGAAIVRLTVRGTVIAHTILNWIPIVGPLANGVTTWGLTKQAGKNCIRDLESNRMTTPDQLKGGLANCIKTLLLSDFLPDDIQDIADEISSESVNAAIEAVSSCNIEAIEKTVQSLPAGSKEVGEKFLTSLAKHGAFNAVAGKNPISKETLRDSALMSLAEGLMANSVYKERLIDSQQSIYDNWKEIFPENFQQSIDRAIQRCVDARNEVQSQKALIQLFENIVDIAAQAKEINPFISGEMPDVKPVWSAEENYHNWVKSVYKKHLYDIQNIDIESIYGKCGKAYEEIYLKNISRGYWNTDKGYDHDLVWFMAEWVQTNIQNCKDIEEMTIQQLSDGITRNNINWIKYNSMARTHANTK